MLCYLNRVYVCNDSKEKIYELVKAPEDFSQVQILRVDKEALLEESLQKDLITDFCFCDSYLRCEAVQKTPATSEIKRTVGRGVVVSESIPVNNNFLIELLRTGVENNFLFVNENVIENDCWVGDFVTPFYQLQCSDDVLTISYYEKGITDYQEQFLIKSVKNNYQFVPFYFAVPADVDFVSPYQIIKSMKINNLEYKIYFAESVKLIEPVDIISPALINKAKSQSMRAKTVVALFKQVLVLQGIKKEEPVKTEFPSWKKQVHTIQFMSSIQDLSDEDISNIITTAKEKIDNTSVSTNGSILKNYYVESLVEVLSKSLTLADIINNCNNAIQRFSKEKIFADLYLFKIRSFECKSGLKRLPVGTMLSGSEEVGVTTVKEAI